MKNQENGIVKINLAMWLFMYKTTSETIHLRKKHKKLHPGDRFPSDSCPGCPYFALPETERARTSGGKFNP